MQAFQKVKQTASVLKEKDIPFPEKEAEWMIFHVTGKDRVSLFTGAVTLDSAQEKQIDEFVARRLEGEPLQYILGFVEFFGLHIRVGEGVLIPRPETELLVEEALKVGITEGDSVLDLCTGSGCIALAIAANRPDAKVVGTDISEKALSFARENARENNIGNIRFLRGNLYDPVEGEKFGLIVSNPPYIRSAEIPMLQREVQREPIQALDGGPDGLAYYRSIIGRLGEFLKADGFCFLEIGDDQGDDIKELAGRHGFKAEVKKDLAGLDRIAVIKSSS